MAQLMIKSGKCLPLTEKNVFTWQQIRHIKRQWVTKYREPHFVRKQMLAACEPIMVKDKRLDSETCEKLIPLEKHQIHPYDKILGEDMKQEWSESRMIAFFHRNSMTHREQKAVRNMFQHQDMFLRYINNKSVNYALMGSSYESALHLFTSQNAILFCAEPNVSKLLKLCKKTTQIILMCAIIDDRFLNLKDIQNYNRLPSLPQLHAQVCHTLSLASQSITSNISQPMSQLSQNLHQYASKDDHLNK